MLSFVVLRWWKQQRPKAEEGRGCDPSPQGFPGRPLQWDIQEAIPLSECYLLQVQGVSTILLDVLVCLVFVLHSTYMGIF